MFSMATSMRQEHSITQSPMPLEPTAIRTHLTNQNGALSIADGVLRGRNVALLAVKQQPVSGNSSCVQK
jgi:hypothetical protein